jgi:membrane protease YdiL (CAAX protease family)
MLEAIRLGGFLAAAVIATLAWGRSLWYFDEQSSVLRRWVFSAMGRSHRSGGEIRALLLSAIYYSLGLLAALLFALAFRLPLTAIAGFRAEDMGLIVFGVVGEISLASLLVDLGVRVGGAHKPERFAELKEIPWMKGLQQLPANTVPIAAAIAGAVEELFFRGILLGILTMRFSVAPLMAVAIVGALFCLEQLIQVRTWFQAMVIGSGCVAISLVGGLLVLARGNVVPAVLCHASFVIFFMTQGAQRKRAKTQVAA